MKNSESLKCNYILVTPVKNEIKYINDVIRSVLNQTIKPSLWIIVDDGSTDGTSLIVKKIADANSWIKSIHLKQHKRDVYTHYAKICNIGFNYAIKYCKKNKYINRYIKFKRN